VNCKNRPTPKRSAASTKTAPRASGKDGGVDARLITPAQRLAQRPGANTAAVQWIQRDQGSLQDRAAVLLPSVSLTRYQFRESSRPVSALGCCVVDLGVQLFAELANIYVNRRIGWRVASENDGF